MSLQLTDPVSALPGIGPVRAKQLGKLGITSIEQLLHWFPRDYEDRRQSCSIREAPLGEPVCITAIIAETPKTSFIRKGMELTRVRAVDESSAMTLTFFNQSYVRTALKPGESYVFFGKAEQSGRNRVMTNPEFEPAGKTRFTGRIMPVYPLTAGISNRLLAGAVLRGLEDCLDQIEDILPAELRQKHSLSSAQYAWQTIHFPPSWEELEVARRRLIFEELFLLSAGLTMLRKRRQAGSGQIVTPRPMESFCKKLPFPLTADQHRSIQEAMSDMGSGRAMNRLLQGDVGSGKTMVAAACIWLAAESGLQSALMAPTELLAQQHYHTLAPLLATLGLDTVLLTGSQKGKARQQAQSKLKNGAARLAIGTHALLTQGEFQSLGLVITDEQHRFGVAQRSALAAKAGEAPPHVLVMSATPIPRTLALIVYGDLDISVLREKPPGRQEVDTFLVHTDKRQRLYAFIEGQIAAGHQAYVVCPAVEDSSSGQDYEGAVSYAETLRQVFPHRRIGLIHGRLKPKEKEGVMADFSAGTLDILVSTTVIEVGVDVPNATLMVVENADRFGLSQLHQLRGRVGRSGLKSYCVLVSDAERPETRQRLRALCATNDGFQIAEEDLRLRGPGDFFGQRQSGLPQLQVADLAEDTRVLYEAQAAARELLEADPELCRPEHALLRAGVTRLFQDNPDSFN